jgi:hypothetical protein
MVTRARWRDLDWAGLAAGPAAWGINLQLNYAASSWICGHGTLAVLLVSGGLAAVSALGAALSWRSWRASPSEGELTDGVSFRLVAGLSVFLGALFAVAILAQGAAALILTGCER